jgi:flagellar biosynthesis/type III secretory pathway M-ring protein FliF/YscJ
VSQRSRESTTQDGDEQGIAGTSANLPELVGAPSKSGRVSTEADETGNYDFPETRVTQSTLPGGITSIQAAVLLAARPNVAARTEAEVEAVRTLVASSLGVEPANVTVSEQPFAAVDVAVETPPVLTAQRLDSAARILLIAAAIGCVFAFVVRPLMRRATAEPPAPEPVAPTPPSLPSPGGDEAFQEFLARMRSGEARATRENVARLVTADVAHSVATLHAWIGADAR